MTRCMGCMREYEDGLNTCPHCGYQAGTPPREAYQLQPETILNGRYLVGRVLGFGGFGTTYLAWDLTLEKKVAVKEYMPSDFATRAPGETQLSVYDGELGEQFRAGLSSFIEESRRLAQFNHEDGIVHIYDSFPENGTAYIVMECLEGKTLKELLNERGGKIPYQEAVAYILPVLHSLDAVHQTGIIHRDIAPDNIFLTDDGKVKLIDFGASRYATTLHSKSLSVILKQGYAPEEQYRSRGEQGPWSDVYAVCATLYRAITGIVPEDALERCTDDRLVPPSKAGVELPQGIENAILNGLNTRAENRIQSAGELAQALSGEIEVERVKEAKVKEDVGRWSKKQILIASCSGVAVLAVIILTVLGVFSLNSSLDTDVYATVPDYIGMTLEEAQADWEAFCAEQGISNVTLSVSDGVTSDQVSGYQTDQIYAISPEVGSWFKKVYEEQKSIYLTVVLPGVQDLIKENQGKDSWIMQNLINYSQEDVRLILESMEGVNFTFEMIASEKSAGTVIRTEPEVGMQINKGDAIIVYVSDGTLKQTVEIINEDNHNSPKQNPADNSVQSLQKYTLTIDVDSGISNVVGAGSYTVGSKVTVQAYPKEGYEISGWFSRNNIHSEMFIEPEDQINCTFIMPAENVTLIVYTNKINVVASGKCGDNAYWTIYDNGELNITGSGPMYDFSDVDDIPWKGAWKGEYTISSVVISYGITTIGDLAFSQIPSITEVSIPDSVTKIGSFAVFTNWGIAITIPNSVDNIGYHAFIDSGLNGRTTIYVKGKSFAPSGWDSEWNEGANVIWDV